MPYIEVMLKSTQLRVDMDAKIGWVQPYRELATIFYDGKMDFTNFFEKYPSGDDDLRGIDPNQCNVKRTDAFLKGNCNASSFNKIKYRTALLVIFPRISNDSRQNDFDEVGGETPFQWPQRDM